VPGPPPHIPRANERTVLQRLSLFNGLSLVQLYPAGKQLFESMLAKGQLISLRPTTQAASFVNLAKLLF
jgi:hypothetical protein